MAAMIASLAANFTPMSSHLDPQSPLPCRADRQKIIEHAEFILTKARTITTQWDPIFTPPSAERPCRGNAGRDGG
jgi:hypothetical protein